MVDYCVEIRRLVWGDYEPRLVGVAHSRDEHIEIVDRDLRERAGEALQRLWIYSFAVFEECDDARSKVHETVAYGDADSLRSSVEELWNNWS